MKEGLFLCKIFVKSKMKAGWGVCFLFRGMSGPVKKCVKSELEFDGIGRDTRGAFQTVEPLFYFEWEPKKRV